MLPDMDMPPDMLPHIAPPCMPPPGIPAPGMHPPDIPPPDMPSDMFGGMPPPMQGDRLFPKNGSPAIPPRWFPVQLVWNPPG